MIKKVMHFLFLSCLKATELIEKKIHFRLSFSEKLQLKMHKSMCDACSKYEKQSLFIEKGISSFQKPTNLQVDLDQLKKRITDQLESASK
jgi:hypothetical protein